MILLIALVESLAHYNDEEEEEVIPEADLRDKDKRLKYVNYMKEHQQGSMDAMLDNNSVKKRFNVFTKNEQEIKNHNREVVAARTKLTFKKELNKFTVMTSKERKLSTGLANVTSTVHKRSLGLRARLQLREVVPQAYDHRVEGHVSPVTNQGSCGSCWAHAAVYSLEGGLAIASGKDAKQLSVQELLSCAYEHEESRNGCSGGWYMDAWKYVKESGHLADSAEEPYEKMDMHCDPDIAEKPNLFARYKVTDWERVPEGDDRNLALFASKHVVSVAIYAGKNLYEYADGIFTDENCGFPARVNHAVALVGFTQDAWIVKNSWGTDWGEKGYVRMSRQEMSNCGIADYAYFPIVEKKKKEKVVPKCATCCESVWGDKKRAECPIC